MDVGGKCVPSSQPPTCTNGTVLDTNSNSCVVDPNDCQDGTVLVKNQCVDPGHLTPDVEEGPEPNGLGLLGEVSQSGAGALNLKAMGQALVVHGKIVPFEDVTGATDPNTGNPAPDGQQDADIDTYTLHVDQPTMLQVSVDGLHGLDGGFVSVAAVASSSDPLAPWIRYGVNVTGDTSKRSLYLPAAGDYVIAATDTRSIYFSNGAPVASDTKEPFEYYMSITVMPVTPTAKTPDANGRISDMGNLNPGETKLYQVPMGEGINSAVMTMDANQAAEALVITNQSGGALNVKGANDGSAGPPDAFFCSFAGVNCPAQLRALGFRTGDTSLVVVDTEVNYANSPVPYDLEIQTGTAGALCNGDTATCPATVAQPADANNFSVFYYDVAGDNTITGMDLHITDGTNPLPVSGAIVDENFFLFSFFTYDPTQGGFAGTFTDYTGLLRHAVPGRYYFLVFDPNFTSTSPAENITTASKYQAVMPVAVVEGTQTADQTPTAYLDNPFTYDAGTTDHWQQFDGSGTSSGVISATFYNPSELMPGNPGFGYGRLDALPSSACGANCDDVTPLFSHTYAQAGNNCPDGPNCRGRILLSDPNTTYFVTINTATVNSNTKFKLNYARRPHTDLGAITVGTPATANTQALDNTVRIQRYLLETTAGNGVEAVASPNNTMDLRILPLNNDETAAGSLVNATTTGNETLDTFSNAGGWAAFAVTDLAGVAGQTFNLTVNALTPVTYAASAGSTAFANACTGGATVVMTDPDEGASISAINTPAGFKYYGFSAPSIRVFSNGFLSVNSALGCPGGGTCYFNPQDMPNGALPNGVIAPYWGDLDTTTGSICQKTSGTKLIIQWTGVLFNTTTVVHMQAILDGSNNTIEFVYASDQGETGASASIGVENQAGSSATELGFQTAGTITAGTSTLLTPQ